MGVWHHDGQDVRKPVGCWREGDVPHRRAVHVHAERLDAVHAQGVGLFGGDLVDARLRQPHRVEVRGQVVDVVGHFRVGKWGAGCECGWWLHVGDPSADAHPPTRRRWRAYNHLLCNDFHAQSRR